MLCVKYQSQEVVHATSTTIPVGGEPGFNDRTNFARSPFLTFFEAEGVALVEQHGVEQQSAVLAERHRGAACVAILP